MDAAASRAAACILALCQLLPGIAAAVYVNSSSCVCVGGHHMGGSGNAFPIISPQILPLKTNMSSSLP